MRLNELIGSQPVLGRKNWRAEHEISGVATDSRRVKPGSLFLACAGPKTDGHLYYEEAVRRGAVALVGETPLCPALPENVTFLQVSDSKEALALLLNRFYHFPSQQLRLVGITGTNGKTTIAHLLNFFLGEELSSTYIGTLGYQMEHERGLLSNTTPGAEELFSLLARAVKEGARAAVLEVSSHALHQKRVLGLEFELAVFTGLSPEHLDYHSSLEDYFQAKRQLFGSPYCPRFVLINQDSPYGLRLRAEHPKAKSFSLKDASDYRASDIKATFEGSEFIFEWPGGRCPFRTRLPLVHNVANATAALACLHLLGFDPGSFRAVLENFSGVPGRMERIDGDGFQVFVDYAHTPDAFEHVLSGVRALGPKRVLTLFGCGGERDPYKRPVMARIAHQYSDQVILTSDNPRTEDPAEILRQIRQGLPAGSRSSSSLVREIPDRREAMSELLNLAEAGDVLLILGKGHETYQILGTERIHFDDREVVREILKRRQVPLG